MGALLTFLRLPSAIYRFLYDHLAGLNDGFHSFFPIKDGREFQPIDYRKYNARFYFGFLINVFTVADFFYNLAKNDFKTNEAFNIMFRYTTRIWPTTLEQRDAIGYGAMILAGTYYFNLVVENWPQQKWFMFNYKSQDASEGVVFFKDKTCVPKKLGKKLVERHKVLHPRMDWITFITVIDLQIVFTIPFFLGEFFMPGPDSWSFWLMVYLVVEPFHTLYCGYSVAFANFLWLNTQYLQIKQRYFIERIQLFLRKNRMADYKASKLLIPAYVKELNSILELMKEIKDYNKFWRNYISYSLFVYILENVYITFALVSAKNWRERAQIIPTWTFGGGYIIYMFIVSTNCSAIIRKNVELHRSLRRFQIRCQNTPITYHIKMSNIDEFQRLFYQTSFRLKNNWTINTRLFEMLLSWIVVISLKLFGEQLIEIIIRE